MPEKKRESGAQPARRTARKTARGARKGERTLTVVQVHSGIGCPQRQRRVLQSLGLRGPHHRRTLPDVPSVRGMVAALPHLVRIEDPAKAGRAAGRKA